MKRRDRHRFSPLSGGVMSFSSGVVEQENITCALDDLLPIPGLNFSLPTNPDHPLSEWVRMPFTKPVFRQFKKTSELTDSEEEANSGRAGGV